MTDGICKTQFGFTRGRRTIDACFVLDTLIDMKLREKRELYVAFIDFQKAYDYVWHEGLFFKMLHKGMIGPVFRIVHSMYESVKSVIMCANEVSEIITQCVGVRQGCVLSPCLFSLFISDLPEFLREQDGQGVCIDKEHVTCLLFADDGAIIANSKEDLQCMLSALHMYLSLIHI